MERLTKMNKTYLLLILFFVPFLAFSGGGWPKKKGTGYYKLSQWWIVSDQHYTSTGQIDPNVTTGIFNTSLYAEYGVTDKFTGIVYFPFFSRSYRNSIVSATTGNTTTEGDAINSLGDTNIGLKYGLSGDDSKFAVAGTLWFGLPLGEDAGGRDRNLQTGDGEFNQMLQLDVSRSFTVGNIPAYANVYTAFNNRTKDFSDEFRYGFELGASFIENKLWLIGRYDVVESLKNGFNSLDGSQTTSIFANNTEFTAITVEAAYYLNKKWGISAAYGGAVRGEIVLANPSYSIGVFLDIK